MSHRTFGRTVGLSILISALVLGALSVGGFSCKKRSSGAPPLLCYVGGTMRPVMKELARLYEKRTGQRIDIDPGGSGELMIKIRQTQMGDLYVCHDPFMGQLMKEGHGVKAWTVASLTPMIAVRRDETRIKGLADLAKPGIRVGLTDAKHSSAGHIVEKMLDKSGLRKDIEKNLITRTRQGGKMATMVGLGVKLDAAVVWNAVIHARRRELRAVPIEPELAPQRDVDAVTSATYGRIDMDYVRVTIATLKHSKHLPAATAFAEFVAGPASQAIFAKYGFSPADASRAGGPDIVPKVAGSIFVHCGAGMKLPAKQLAKEFAAATGVKVETSYMGSNRLLGQIDLSRRGDVYIPGDTKYVEMARDKGLVTYHRRFCYLVPTIMVRKDYADRDKIKSLADLARPGLRVGLGDKKAAAVGRLIPELMRLNGVDLAAVTKNLKLSTATVNELGAAIEMGTLDAVIVWNCIAAMYPQACVTVEIPPAKNIIPEVSAATLTTAANPVAARAFVDFITGPRGREVLGKYGYVTERPK